jgi:O-antigen ligase
MNKIITQKKIVFSAYMGILLLYLKLFLIEPIFIVDGIDITAAFLLLLIVLFRVVFKLVFQKVNVFGDNKSARIFWLYIIFSTLSSFFLSPDIASGVVTVNLQLFLVYLLFIDFKSVKIDAVGLKKVISGLVYFAIINTLLVFYTFFFGKIGLLGEVSGNAAITRAFGLMGDQLPWFLSFFAIHALYNKKTYLFLFFASGILMGASVGATIVLVISSLIYLFKGKKIKPSFYLKAGFLIVFFILVSLFSPDVFNKIGILQRYNQGDFAGKEAQTTGHRFNAISTAIDNISEKPLLGYHNYSLTMFNKYNRFLSDSEKGDLTYLTTPNNQLLAVICDYGFFGFILFVFFIYRLIKIVRKKCIELPIYLGVFKESAYVWLTVFILFNQSATWFLPGSFLWVLICLIIAISYKINQIYGVKQKINYYS